MADETHEPLRLSQKAATRRRVLDAARELFDTHGYDGTTIRAIAQHAGVAVGSVFTTFASKGEILSEVMASRLEPLYAELDRVMPHVRGSTTDRLRTMFAVCIEFEARTPRLFLSHIAAAFDWTLPAEARPYGRNAHLMEMVRSLLRSGVERGDVRSDVEVDHIIDLVLAAYAWGYRRLITEDADTASLIAAMDRHLGLIAEGFVPRS